MRTSEPKKLPAWFALAYHAGVAVLRLDSGDGRQDRAAEWRALAAVMADLDIDPAVNGIVLTGAATFAERDPATGTILSVIAGCAVPVVAAISGAAIGSGLDLALACRHRVAAAGAQFALPGIRHGRLPSNGTVERLASLLPLPQAADMLAFGTALPAEAAMQCGLIDAVARGPVLGAAIAFLRRSDDGKIERRRRTLSPGHGPRQFAELRAQVQRRAPGQVGPLAAIEALEHTYALPADQSLRATERVAQQLAGSEQAIAIRMAVAVEARTLRAMPDKAAHGIGSACLIELGAAGTELAAALARAGVDVTIVAEPVATQGVDLVIAGAGATAAQWQAVLTRCAADTVVAANPFADVPSGIDPDRLATLHAYAPGGRVRLVELGAAGPAERTLWTLMQGAGLAVLRRGRDPGGVLVDRLRWPLLREAIHLLDEGATPRQIDTALLNFGFTAAPFASLDREGLASFVEACVERRYGGPAWLRFSPTLDMMLEAERFGVDAGRGWYRYEPGSRTPLPDPHIDLLLRDSALAQWLRRREIADAEIVERCLIAAIGEAYAALDDTAAPDASTIDAIWTGIIGFPRWRGGLLLHARSMGLAEVAAAIRRTNELRGTLPPPPASLVPPGA
jgi:3-hydroxyacyl-CoA dehydrogenase